MRRHSSTKRRGGRGSSMGKLRPVALNELKQGSTPQNRFALERLVFFSDAVFAIAITILVLDIRLPTGEASAGSHELFLSLTSLWQEYLAFFISFWVIGLCWISHHRKFLHIRRVDNQLLLLNLFTLMMIVFIPFPTAVLSESINFTATAFYALTMILACLSGLMTWWLAVHNHRLVDPNLDRRQIWREASVPLATIVIFVISVALTNKPCNIIFSFFQSAWIL
jgi:uncharacterized membrane protein